jgi:hypothetical protein
MIMLSLVFEMLIVKGNHMSKIQRYHQSYVFQHNTDALCLLLQINIESAKEEMRMTGNIERITAKHRDLLKNGVHRDEIEERERVKVIQSICDIYGRFSNTCSDHVYLLKQLIDAAIKLKDRYAFEMLVNLNPSLTRNNALIEYLNQGAG